MPDLTDFVHPDRLQAILDAARDEDLGPDGLDVTSAAFVPEDATTTTRVVARQAGVLAGLAAAPRALHTYSPLLTLDDAVPDGSPVTPGQAVATIAGPSRAVLAVERVLLNLLTHLSGIATLTAEYNRRVAHTTARVCCTRKTHAGLRGLEKYAVACGGGLTHRFGLYDAVLVKDNHLAGVPLDEMPRRLAEAAAAARRLNPGLKFIEVEVDTLDQLRLVLTAPIDIALPDQSEKALYV